MTTPYNQLLQEAKLFLDTFPAMPQAEFVVGKHTWTNTQYKALVRFNNFTLQQGSGPEPSIRRRLTQTRKAIIHKFNIGETRAYLIVGLYEDGTPGEIFVNVDKLGSTISGLVDSFAILMSFALQYGLPLKELVAKFKHVRFEPAGFTGNKDIPMASSIIDYIFTWLEKEFVLGGSIAANPNK